MGDYRYKQYLTEQGTTIVYVDGSMNRFMSNRMLLAAGVVLIISASAIWMIVIFFSKRAVRPVAERAAEEESIPAYVRIGESQIIYEITETEYESLMAISYNELRHQEIFWADFDKVTKADLTLEGETYTLTSGKEGDETVWFYGEEEITIDDFQTALTALTAKRFKNEEVGAKEELSMTLYLNDENYPTVHIGMYRRDGDTCMAVVDGEPTALVTRSKVVDLMEAVNAIVLR